MKGALWSMLACWAATGGKQAGCPHIGVRPGAMGSQPGQPHGASQGLVAGPASLGHMLAPQRSQGGPRAHAGCFKMTCSFNDSEKSQYLVCPHASWD